MWKDPIVEEVRKAGEKLAKQANYDLHIFFQNLREKEGKKLYKGTLKINQKQKELVSS